MKKKDYLTLKIVHNTPFGIYKGAGSYPYYGGELHPSGEPAASIFYYPSSWFKTKKDAIAKALKQASQYNKFIANLNR